MKPENKEMAIVAGALAGAIQMGLLLSVVLSYGVGAKGIVLMFLLIGVSGVVGWMLGYQNRGRGERSGAYQKGYQDGQRDAGIVIHPNPNTQMTFGFKKLI